jgi:hypothetical protein
MAASGGTPPYSWSAAGLPSGLSLSAAGALTGTPQVSGSSSVSFTVTDSNLNAATASLGLTINTPVPPVTITTASLPGGTVGTAYSQTLAASGGTPPYSWSAAGLPSGLSLSAAGALTGMPQVSGSSSVSFTVTDSNQNSATSTLSLTINAGAGGPTYIDPFTSTTMNTSVWCKCVLDQGAGSPDTSIALQQGSGQLRITPRSNVAGLHFNGYRTVAPLNMTGASLTVRVFQSTTGLADNTFALGVDTNNWYKFIQEGGTLWVETEVAGVMSVVTTVPYNATAQQYWRFSHTAGNNQLRFQTSPDNSTWTTVTTINASVPVSALYAGINAGTWKAETSPGVAVFGPIFWQLN